MGFSPRAAETMKKFSATKLVPAIIWTAVIYYMTFDGQITANVLTDPFGRRRSSFKIQTRALKTAYQRSIFEIDHFSRVTHKYTYYKIQKNKLPKKSNKIDSWTWNKIRSTSKSNFFSSIQVLFYVMIPLKSEVTPLPSNKGPINIFIKKKHDR